MSMDTAIQTMQVGAPPVRDERFAARKRMVLLEPDPALRAVLVRSLLALGCVVSAKHETQQVIEALRCGPLDGAVIAFVSDTALAALQSANVRGVPLVVLTESAVEPRWLEKFPAIRFVRKPFDTRQLLTALELPQKAILVPTE